MKAVWSHVLGWGVSFSTRCRFISTWWHSHTAETGNPTPLYMADRERLPSSHASVDNSWRRGVMLGLSRQLWIILQITLLKSSISLVAKATKPANAIGWTFSGKFILRSLSNVIFHIMVPNTDPCGHSKFIILVTVSSSWLRKTSLLLKYDCIIFCRLAGTFRYLSVWVTMGHQTESKAPCFYL